MDSSVLPTTEVDSSAAVESTLNSLTIDDVPALRRTSSKNDKKDVTDAKAER